MFAAQERSLDRAGALAGVVAVLLLVTLVTVVPALPGPDASVAQISRAAAENTTALLLGSYLGALMGAALLVFGAACAGAVRRGDDSGWWLVGLAGIAATSFGIAGNAISASWVRSVEHGARGDALWFGYSIDHSFGTLVAVPLAVFLLGIGMAGRGGALGRLAPVALVVAALLVVGAGSISGNELEGGPLAIPLFLGYIGLLVWIVWTSVVLWRGAARPAPARVDPAPAAP